MNITVVVCTYNRCQSLAQALESVACSRMPASVDWNVLVVDNNSRDQTPSVVEDYRRRYPNRFRYLFESRPGKSHALNAALRAAQADVLAFMDDDVKVDPDWLHNLTSCFRDPQWAGAGGRILPQAEFSPPSWLDTTPRYALAPLAMFDLGLDAGELHEAPFGTNMAYRREMFIRHGGFRTDFGPCPSGDIQHNEDSEFGCRLLTAGERLWYAPSAVVYHATPAERITQKYFLAWWYDKSKSDVRQRELHGSESSDVGVSFTLYRRFIGWSVRWMLSVDPARRFRSKLNVWKLLATIQEGRRLVQRAALRANQPAPPSLVSPQEGASRDIGA